MTGTTDTPSGSGILTGSGVDLARVALRNARAAAKAQPRPKRRTGASASGRARTGGRDPLAFGDALARMVAERGWDTTAAAAATTSSVMNQWLVIAPELAGKVEAVRFDSTTRTLHLLPATPAYRAQLTLHQKQVIAKVNAVAGPDTVQHLQILLPAVLTTARASCGPNTPSTPTTAPPPAGAAGAVKTRAEASAGYHQVLAAHRAAWTAEKKTDAKVLAAARRQIRDQAREPQERFGDGRQALEDLRTKAAAQARASSDASRARALQRLAAERAGLTTITPATAPRLDRTA
ncbi:DciA family protein [Streptomyces sp. NPDC102437]|uniref:DciA family protein n=1 Tax=Streptomyces sp. NPDC102437 TaxID=3366175 RepID=UPI003818277B